MLLEMGQVDHVVVIRDMGADKVVFDPFVVLDRNLDFAFRIHDVYRGDGREAVGLDDFQMVLGGEALPGVGGVAFDDGAVHFLHQTGNEFGFEVVVAAHFTRGNLDGDAARGFAAEGFIDFHEAFGGDLLREIDDGGFIGSGGSRGFRTAVAAGGDQDEGHGEKSQVFHFHIYRNFSTAGFQKRL